MSTNDRHVYRKCRCMLHILKKSIQLIKYIYLNNTDQTLNMLSCFVGVSQRNCDNIKRIVTSHQPVWGISPYAPSPPHPHHPHTLWQICKDKQEITTGILAYIISVTNPLDTGQKQKLWHQLITMLWSETQLFTILSDHRNCGVRAFCMWGRKNESRRVAHLSFFYFSRTNFLIL